MEKSERRRTPRVRLSQQESCELHLVMRVQLLDISVNGVLVGSEVQLPVGTHGQLRFGLGGSAFAPTVEVRRRAFGPQLEGLGTVFKSMDAGSRRRLEEYLRKATP
jgi:hypothetical protein